MRLLMAYLSLLRIQLISGLQFRAAAWSRFVSMLFYGFVHVVLIGVFYRYGEHINADFASKMDFRQAVSYVWLIQVLVHLLPTMSMDSEVWQKIRNGDIGIELCRPLDLYFHWFTRAAASRLTPFLIQLLPITAIAMLLPEPFRLAPPASLAGFLAALLALAAAFLLSCATLGLTYALLMNVGWGEGPAHILGAGVMLLAGAELPLQLWPAWAQGFLYWQPFAGLIDIPLRLYVGTMAPGLVWQAIAMQLAWTGVFVVIGRAWMAKYLKALVIQGG